MGGGVVSRQESIENRSLKVDARARPGVHTLIPGSPKAEAGRAQGVIGQSGLHETLFSKKKTFQCSLKKMKQNQEDKDFFANV